MATHIDNRHASAATVAGAFACKAKGFVGPEDVRVDGQLSLVGRIL